jgi:glycosyltransferase involved in cell wall biosynthesis
MDNILLVLPPANTWSADFGRSDLGYAQGLVSLLAKTSSLTVLIPSDIDVTKFDDYLKSEFGYHAKVISLDAMNHLRTHPRDTRLIEDKRFVDLSLRIYEYICQSRYNSVIFDVFEATGFIPIRAKRTGLGLEKTLLATWLRTCHEFDRDQLLDTSQYSVNFLAELELEFAERYCCRYSDLVIAQTDTILRWVDKRDWDVDRSKVVQQADLKTNRHLSRLLEKKSEFDSISLFEGPEAEKREPCLSVCIAHFNDGRNLQYLLKSVKKSDYKNFEVIIVDDGSTDVESLEIFDSLASEYSCDSWRFIRKEKNESLGPTRNFAVNLARGEFIFFLDSDDLISNTLISDFVRGMLHSQADCLTCPLVYFEGDGEITDERSFVHFWLPLGACLEIGIYNDPFGGAICCIKKSVFEALKGFCSPRGEVHEDWEFLARLVMAGFDMDVLPKALYFYRVRPGSWLQTARSDLSVQKIRSRILAASGPEHTKIIHDLLLRTVAENDRLRVSVWKLDRKIVKIAFKLVEVINEKTRVRIEEMATWTHKRLNVFHAGISRFIKAHNVLVGMRGKTRPDPTNLTEDKIDNSRFFIRSPSDVQIDESSKDFGLPLSRPIFGLVGEMNHEKSINGFLRLAYWMQMAKDDGFFVILGNRAFDNQIRTTVTKYNLDNFKWIPFLEKPEELFAMLSGLVITSQVGKLPIQFFEALASGIPVFSTDLGEARHVVRKYGSGVVASYDPQHKDFADCFSFWKSNLEIYKIAAVETAGLIQRDFGF